MRRLTLEEFLALVPSIELAGEAVCLWIAHRASLAVLPVEERQKAWDALAARTQQVSGMFNAKVWLKKSIAESDARRLMRE